MEKERLLLVLPSIPYPERKDGLAIRYFPILQRLAEIYHLDCIITLFNGEVDEESLSVISTLFDDIKIINMATDRKISYLKRIKFMLSRLNIHSPPDGLYSYHVNENAKIIADTFNAKDYRNIIFVTMNNTHELDYLLRTGLDKNKVVVDIIDSRALNYSRHPGMDGLKGRFILRQTINWEARVIKNCARALYISKKDRDYITPYISAPEKLQLSPNGIFIEGYHTGAVEKPEFPSIGFLGNMSYPPNIKGAQFAYDAYKQFTSQYGPLKYYIIGRDPAAEISKLACDPNIIVTGTVDDIWEYVNCVDIFIIVLSDGAGQQNKLLEVMHASKAVIANSIANAGICASDEIHALIVEDVDHCVSALKRLVDDPGYREKLGRSGHDYVDEEFSWDNSFNRYLQAINALQR